MTYMIRKINAKKLAGLAKSFYKEKQETGVLAIQQWGHVQIQAEYMTDIAPLDKWLLNIPKGPPDSDYPFEHQTRKYGVVFYCISMEEIKLPEETDESK